MLLNEYFPEKYGIETTLVDTSNLDEIKKPLELGADLVIHSLTKYINASII